MSNTPEWTEAFVVAEENCIRSNNYTTDQLDKVAPNDEHSMCSVVKKKKEKTLSLNTEPDLLDLHLNPDIFYTC